MACSTVLAWCLLVAPLVQASTVAPYTFQTLIDRADAVLVAEVIDVESRWTATRTGRAIVTLVTFRVERTLKGAPRLQERLEFLGGRVGDLALEVSGVPRFSPGDRDVLCVQTGAAQVSPVVGLTQGRFRITNDPQTGQAFVTTADGFAIGSVGEVGQPRRSVSTVPVRTLTLAELEREIARAVAAGARP